MSHANGEVIHNGLVVGHFEYNGTGDFAYRRIFPTHEELHRHWRTDHADDAACSCGKEPVAVILYSDYGSGFNWDGKACLECCCIVEGNDPWPEDGDSARDGYPLRK